MADDRFVVDGAESELGILDLIQVCDHRHGGWEELMSGVRRIAGPGI